MVSYIDAVGGAPLQPSDIGYRAITLSATTTFSWPFTNEDSPDVVATQMEVTASSAGLGFLLPSALFASNGQGMLFHNAGSNPFTVEDNSGNTIQAIPPGGVYLVFLQDNTTQNGLWGSFAIGSGSPSPGASALAGYGLTAIGATLNQSHPVSSKTANYEIVASDRAQTIVNNGGTVTFSIDSYLNLGNNWFCLVKNNGTGAVTIAPSDTSIDGAASVTLNAEDACFVICSGSVFYTVGLGRAVQFTFTRIVIPVSGNSDVTLTAAQAGYSQIEFSGTLTGNINVIMPNAVAQWYIYNNTSGGFSITVKTAAGTGYVITNLLRHNLLSDGTNVVLADSYFPQTRTIIDVSGGADVTLTAVQAAFTQIHFIGTLTANINIIVPTAVDQWYMDNATTGGFNLTIKTAAGSGIVIFPGTRHNLLCDGTNVIIAESYAFTPPVLNKQYFTSSGTLTVPAGALPTTVFRFIIQGGGGAGANGGAASNPTGGGGAGGYGVVSVSGLTASSSIPITIGAGGLGATGGSNIDGPPGGTTTITLPSGSVTATGGGGGLVTSGSGRGGIGGTATGCDFMIQGQSGGFGLSTGSVTTSIYASGGSSPLGFGGSGMTGTTVPTDKNGTGYGSGGAGIDNPGGSVHAGNGANGIVIVEYVL